MEHVSTINIIIGMTGFFWLLARTANRWSEYPREMRLLLIATLGFVFTLLETSAEQILFNLNGSINPFIIMAVKLYLLYVLFVTRTTKYRTGTRQADGNPEEDQNRNVR